MTVPLLTPDSGELVEAIARRVVELLDERERASGLVDAASLAQVLGVSRAYVYEHRGELGAITVGDGARPRLRFDVEKARAAWSARTENERSLAAAADVSGGSAPVVRRRRRAAARSEAGLLPIKGSAW